jgi:hypothetical protein
MRRSKTDREGAGAAWRFRSGAGRPVRSGRCVAGLKRGIGNGRVFRRIDRHGHLGLSDRRSPIERRPRLPAVPPLPDWRATLSAFAARRVRHGRPPGARPVRSRDRAPRVLKERADRPVHRPGRALWDENPEQDRKTKRRLEATPQLNRVLETALYADDLQRAASFYADVLGLRRLFVDARLQALRGRRQVRAAGLPARCVAFIAPRKRAR